MLSKPMPQSNGQEMPQGQDTEEQEPETSQDESQEEEGEAQETQALMFIKQLLMDFRNGNRAALDEIDKVVDSLLAHNKEEVGEMGQEAQPKESLEEKLAKASAGK